jgi:hypothetical protein
LAVPRSGAAGARELRAFLGPGDIVPVEAAFVWQWRARRGVKAGSVRGSTTVSVECLPPDECPVVISLAAPNGGWMDVRRHGQAWLRPVLEPGSWKPIAVDRFVRAMASGEPWRDSPIGIGRPKRALAGRLIETRTLVAVDDYAEADAAATPREAAAIAEAAAERHRQPGGRGSTESGR